jgi:hypothetical protein
MIAMRRVGIKVRMTLNRLRKIQRDKQLEIEARIKDVEEISSKYCHVCKLNFRQSEEEHRESEDHTKIKTFLKPYCKVKQLITIILMVLLINQNLQICRMQFISPIKYEIHRCHTDHIRRKLKSIEVSDSPTPYDEVDLDNMDINDFKTLDSVGDEDEEVNEDEGKMN